MQPADSRPLRHCNHRRAAAVLLVAAAFVPVASCAATESSDPLTPRHWRCVWTEDPATAALLSWSTTEAGQRHAVHLKRIVPAGAEAELSADSVDERTIAAQRNGRHTGDSAKLFYHHARVDQLAPGATYQVVFETDGRRSPTMHFTTAPDDDRPIALLFGADSRSGISERQQMNRLMARMVAESYAAERPPILALAHGGDFVYDGSDVALWSQWLDDHEQTVGADGRLLPIIPARGNHDHSGVFNEVFGFPEGDRNYYAVNVGPQVRLVTLNTETSVAGDQTKWLAAELESARPHNRWLVAQYHRPAFPAVKLPGRALVHWVPLFEQFNVDLVCEGDGHNIKRTPPVRANKIDPTGVPYIGEGGLGVGQRAPKPERWYLKSPDAKVGQDHHVQLLQFDRDQLSYRVVLMSGETFDEHAWPVRPAAQRLVPGDETLAPAARAAAAAQPQTPR